MITSFIDGRVRIRHAGLKSSEKMHEIVDLLVNYDGVRSVRPNQRTGSVLIHYDCAKISKEMLSMAASMLEAQLTEPESEIELEKKPLVRLFRSQCNTEMVLLTLTLVTCVISGLNSSGRVHLWVGGIFTSLALVHLYRRKDSFCRRAKLQSVTENS